MSVLSSGGGFVISEGRAAVRFEHMGEHCALRDLWRWGSDGVGGEHSKGVGPLEDHFSDVQGPSSWLFLVCYSQSDIPFSSLYIS